MPVLFGGVRAPSTLGSFLRAFTWGNVLKLGKVNRLLLGELARRAPLLPDKDVLAFVDIDSMQKRVYGHHSRARRSATQSRAEPAGPRAERAGRHLSPRWAPGDRRHPAARRHASSARGAASFATEAVHTARATGCPDAGGAGRLGVLLRGVHRRRPPCRGFFSVTVAMTAVRPRSRRSVRTPGRPINYPRAIWDDQLACWVSDAEVAETAYTAFTSRGAGDHRPADRPPGQRPHRRLAKAR